MSDLFVVNIITFCCCITRAAHLLQQERFRRIKAERMLEAAAYVLATAFVKVVLMRILLELVGFRQRAIGRDAAILTLAMISLSLRAVLMLRRGAMLGNPKQLSCVIRSCLYL